MPGNKFIMKEEKILIDKKLLEIRDNVLLILDPNYYKTKAKSIQSLTLSRSVSEYIPQLIKELDSLPQIGYLELQLTDLISGLDEKLAEKHFQNISSSLLKERSIGWSSIKSKINEFISSLSKSLYDESINSDVSIEDVVLSRNQICLFIAYLRDLKVISNSLSDKAVSSCFHELTGFSAEKIRQKISGISKSERNQITDLEVNYDNLKEVLKSMIDRIEDDKRKAILKKDK